MLVQGVPFSISVDVAPAVKEAGVPLVILPHIHDQVKSEKLSFEESLKNEQEKSRQLQAQLQALLGEYGQAKSEKLSFEESLRNEQEKSRQLQLDLEDATRLRNKLEKLIMVKQQEIVLILRRVVSECTERHCRKIIGPCFNENLYLEINQDVALAISENKMASGLDHWIRFGLHGRAGGRRALAGVRPGHRKGAPGRQAGGAGGRGWSRHRGGRGGRGLAVGRCAGRMMPLG